MVPKPRLERQTSETSCGRTHQYQYDLAGNRVEVLFGGTGKTITSTYDALNRLSTMEEDARTTLYGYDLNGNILELELPNGDVTTNSYDALNRTVSKSTENQADVVIALYEQSYDLVGNVVEIEETYPNPADHRIVSNSYDDIYRLVQENISGATNRITQYVYDGANNRVSKTVDGATSNFVHNSANQLVAVNGVKTARYDYDANGNRWHKRDAKPNTGDHLLTESGFSLVTENGRKLAVEAPSTTNYLISEEGQFFTTESGEKILAEGVPAAWRLGTENGFTLLTEDGDAILGDGITPGNVEEIYEYDYENRLVKLTQNDQEYHYAYDYRTRRIFRNEGHGDETVVFSGGTSCQEYANPSTLTVEYIRGSDYGGGIGGILYTCRDNVPSFTHYNGRGDVTLKSNLGGVVTYQAQYEAFGTRTSEQGTTPDRQKANTKDEDPTGLLNEGFRYRDLETGAFITKDPLGFVDGPNLYSYVVQNPWSAFDPEGLATLIDTDISEPTEKQNDDYVHHAKEVVRKMDESAPSKSAKMDVSETRWEAYESYIAATGPGMKDSDGLGTGYLFRKAHMAMARAAVHVSNNGETYGPLSERLETWSLVAGVYTVAAPSVIEYVAAYQASRRTVPLGFTSAEQFSVSVSELNLALTRSGISDATIGVRGSSTTGFNTRTLRPFHSGSDVDFYAQSAELTFGRKTSKSIPGFVYQSEIYKRNKPIADWAKSWSDTLGRRVGVGGFQPGPVPGPVINP